MDVTGLVQRPVVNGLLPVVLRVQLAVHIQTHLKPTCHASVNTNTPTTNTSCISEHKHTYNQHIMPSVNITGHSSMNTDTPTTNR